jgi:tetratricopeptide (TPR) repeat protein
MSTMRPNDLLFAHRYAEAVLAHEKHMMDQPHENYHAGLGDALLGLKHFQKALSSFRRNDEIENSRLKGSFPSLGKAGAALWLMGQRREAMETWHHAVAGILDGTIKYGDLAGGGGQGLLLWYAAVTLHDADQLDYAVKYLHKLQKKKVYGQSVLWPRPVILMVLGERSFADVLNDGLGSPELSECLRRAGTDLLKRRRLCQALFYDACREREAGNEPACLLRMQVCSQLENPILEEEWYLARGECDAVIREENAT